jgi:hypothetical protein
LRLVSQSSVPFEKLLSGVARDGWAISDEMTNGTFGITTRRRLPCPDGIVGGLDRDDELDSSFSITCI